MHVCSVLVLSVMLMNTITCTQEMKRKVESWWGEGRKNEKERERERERERQRQRDMSYKKRVIV